MLICVLAAVPATSFGQAVVEYGLGAAAAGTASVGPRGAAQGIAGALSNLTKTLNAGKESRAASLPAGPASPASTASPVAATSAAESAKPALVYENPAGIRAGMEAAELLRRFGEPAMMVTSGPGQQSLTYEGGEARFEVEMRDGKVATVQKKSKPRQAAVVKL
jgi:hypothetical protein